MHLAPPFPYIPKQQGWNKPLRTALPLVKRMIRLLADDTDFWFDNHWIVDSTPTPYRISRTTVNGSEVADRAGYGYCASHSRFVWGLRPYPASSRSCTPSPPQQWALLRPQHQLTPLLRNRLPPAPT
ncbi:hypothetical protein [Streptomyces spectabilis]|uniref:Transposase n=1 Tax=Streptomyces spectabilis TaxID=68270 RepID=A0A7W8F091_STRST|nr:hypothetical protein [Streptomyces spectabilis]MBB5109964.1 hypothetical protein [Streptomyces spectabilis]GGV56714.1 hypothetical protein GCM10010245_89720 [Streptomyces spectabilis]